MKRSTDPRHQARILALQELFSKFFKVKDFPRDLIPVEDLLEINKIEEYDKDLYQNLVEGVLENTEEIDKIIVKYAPQWPIEQMKLVDLQILRISIFEGFLAKITPPKVAIDEAIEVARGFGGEVSSKFINGVLGAIYEESKNQEEQNE
ncbi:MAG: transcription antitermination factor NusB [Candidatus Dojkabacteria bacterium]|jgi:N utilization substance protein B|nr:transcription antitermination factor NusB [Candidatus Dojkabacteria bacterium]MDD4561119.1 transcription antitermination factor NusB [Candidatus Dojkabacteria bacterium]